ncbi:retrovirus-related pol polyprotein from transposon TNT 1-94 [Tanacetum coccineum]
MWTALKGYNMGPSLECTRCEDHSFWEFGNLLLEMGRIHGVLLLLRFYKLMNELTRNDLQVSPMQVIVIFLQQHSTRMVMICDGCQSRDREIDTGLYPSLFEFLETQFQNEVNVITYERISQQCQILLALFLRAGFGLLLPGNAGSQRVKDYAYHKEKMMMCKQAEQGVPLRAEQADWLEDTDEEIDDQELEAHYSYMAKIQETKQTELEKYTALNDLTSEYKILQTKLNDTLGLLALKDIDIKEGLKTKTYEISVVNQKHDELVKEGKDIDTMIEMDKQIKFLNEILYKRNQSIQTIHMLAPKCATYHGRSTFANPKYLKMAQSDKPRLYEIPYDTSDPANRFCPDGEETVTLEKESRSKLDKDTVKPYNYTYQNSLYETFKPPSKAYLDQLERAKEVRKTMWRKTSAFPNPTAKSMEVLIKILLMPLSDKTILDSHCFIHELKREMNDDLEYVNSLEKELDELESEKADFSNIYDLLLKECVSKDVTCSYLHSLSNLNAHAKLQCLYLHKVKGCECIAQKLSKQTESVNKEVHNKLLKSFAKLENHSISLELALQHCKEQMKNNSVCKENGSNVFRKEREQYHEIQDLKAQMQEKNIAISELQKLIEKCKGKSVETQFDKPSVVRQPNAQRIPKPSVLGKPTPFSNSPEMRSFQTKQSVNKTNVLDGLFKQVTQQNLPQNRKQAEIHSNVLKPGMYRIATTTTQNREPQLPHASRNTNPHMSKSSGVIHTTSVSRPQLKCYQVKDKVVPNNSQVKFKKKEVEDHHRISSISKKTKSVTVYVNARTKKPNVVPISASKPKRKANKSVATPYKKTVASDTTIQKSKSYYKELYENTNQEWKWKEDVSTSISPTIDIVSRITNVLKISNSLGSNLSNVPSSSNSLADCTVRFGNDQFAPILGYGDLNQGNITIKWVYYVEGLNHNLFSVGQFCDADLEVAFKKSTCFVRDLQGNDLLTGNRGSDLYTISLQETTSSTPICFMAKASPTQAWLWHRRLSHLNFDYITLLSKKDVVTGLPKLNLLHMDLCGPMRVASINGKKYILVIVDDYSRYTWTLFLRSKDETPEVLKDFLTMIQRNLQAQVITVRTDRGTEFLNKTLHAYFKEEGIEHQTSTPRTPEQNGVVERRNRTLVEAARMMLSASKLPLSFWAEAVATACYTQNRSIIISTHGKTAYHIINDRKPSIKHLHIFGCICYITRDGENLDKMKEKGDPCVMVGYSTQSKGYRVYNKRTRLIVESIHIKFDEIKEMTFVQNSSGLVLHCQMMSDHNSSDLAPQRQEMSVENVTSGLVPQGQKASDYDNSGPVPPRQNVVPTAEKTDSSHQGLEFLFSPLIEEYYTPTHGQAEENNNDQAPNASFQEDEFINPFCTRVQETGESSSRNIDNTDVHSFQPQSHDYRWTRDHPLEQVRGNPTMPVQTRRQLATDPEMCMFALTHFRRLIHAGCTLILANKHSRGLQFLGDMLVIGCQRTNYTAMSSAEGRVRGVYMSEVDAQVMWMRTQT